MSRISKNWTGKYDPECNILPPKSDDYNDWTAEQVRKECTNRGLGVTKSLKKDPRIAILIKCDHTKEMIKVQCPLKRTANCNIRLLNVLFSNEFCSDLTKLGNKHDRGDLDNDQSSIDKYWERVHEAYLIEDKYRELVKQDEWFKYDINHVILPHEATKLKEMWHELRRKYMRVQSNQKNQVNIQII